MNFEFTFSSRVGIMKSKLPHIHVYARLAPSKIHGIGVFAIRNISKGTNIFPDVEDPIFWIDKDKVINLPANVKRLYRDYCVVKAAKYGCPDSFNKINITWYLNHSFKPNAALDEAYHIIAARNIRKGEEGRHAAIQRIIIQCEDIAFLF